MHPERKVRQCHGTGCTEPDINHSSFPPCSFGIPASFDALRIPRDAPLTHFQQYWTKGIPVVVTGLHACLQGDWTPAYFMERYGSQKVTLVDCETDSMQQSTVSDFFRNFDSSSGRQHILKLKVNHPLLPVIFSCSSLVAQDWPPQTHFRDEFPELFNAFMDAVPYGDNTRLDGVLNLAAHFPLNGVAPDLG